MRSIVLSLVILSVATVCCGMLNTINCPDCGNVVSVRAFMCPKCGCNQAAIQQHVKAVDALSRMPPQLQKKFSNDAYFGQMGRLIWLKEERIVYNVLTNENAALASYTQEHKAEAKAASATVKRILGMGFTMNHIFIMRHDLISAIIGDQTEKALD